MPNQPDIVVDKQQKTAVVIDVAIPSDGNIRKKEHEKVEKYQGLREECKCNDILLFFSHSDRLFQEGWVHFRSSFYYISSTEKTWQKSQDDCLSRGADLTIVDSREEQDFLRRLSKVMWIGLTDRAEERTWRWVDGTVLNTSYWSDRQPNNWRGKQDCAEVQTSDVENNWNDARCDSQNYWVCEKKVAP
uniref:C-type lectin domain-containing protein n=1 Tax=Salarias fasciatus TaxID=181472 RepID=A0A672HX89_SALFA